MTLASQPTPVTHPRCVACGCPLINLTANAYRLLTPVWGDDNRVDVDTSATDCPARDGALHIANVDINRALREQPIPPRLLAAVGLIDVPTDVLRLICDAITDDSAWGPGFNIATRLALWTLNSGGEHWDIARALYAKLSSQRTTDATWRAVNAVADESSVLDRHEGPRGEHSYDCEYGDGGDWSRLSHTVDPVECACGQQAVGDLNKACAELWALVSA